MSRGSTASAKTPTPLSSQSAWARGPPQNNSSAPSTRSHSPAPSHAHPITATHSRRPSALGQGVPVKEGVSVPRNNVGSVKQGPTVGSSKHSSRPSATAPSISSSTSAAAGSSSASPAATSTAPSTSSGTSTKPTFNVAKLFQDVTSPSLRPTNLPHQPSSAGMRPPRGTGGSGSPAFPRAVPNGTGPGGPGGPPIPTSLPPQAAPHAIHALAWVLRTTWITDRNGIIQCRLRMALLTPAFHCPPEPNLLSIPMLPRLFLRPMGRRLNWSRSRSPVLSQSTTPIPPPSPSEEDKRKREEQARIEQEKLEAAEREKKEEEERKRKEEEEAKRREEEEEEKRRKEKEEEEERARKEEEEKQRQEEERKQREEEEREEKEREELEQERRELAEQEERERAEREAERQRLEEAETETLKASDILLEVEEGEVIENGEVVEPPVNGASDPARNQKESLRIDTSELARRRPGPLDINAAKKDSSTPPRSALLTARNIDRLDEIEYPEGIRSPKTELNENVKDGKFKYDRDFLLQFMAPVDQTSFGMSRGGSGPMSTSGSRPPPPGPFAMGQFGTPGSKLTSEERFQMSQGVRSASVSGGPAAMLSRPALTRTPSQGGPGGHPMGGHRVRSKRGEKRSDSSKVGPAQQGPGYGPSLEPVAPLEMSANRWVPSSTQRKPTADVDTPGVVDRKVKSLLNKLTMEKFDSISDQIIAWANKSENEKDGRTLIQVIKLVFEKATDEANWSEMYARLCRKMMETISPKVQDDGIKNAEGKPITGGQLFRKYLLNRCQEDFEHGWAAKESTARAAAAKASDDEATKAANEKKGDESELYSDEYYAAQKAKRQGLGLIKFIGELFKLQMLTERIMHECVKKLLGNVENPEEEEIESLCQLLRTVGQLLDVPKARAHMDVYFQRMRELCKSTNVSPRMQFMLQDVIELRDRKWQPRNVVNAPTTLAAVHEAAAKEKAVQEAQAFQRQFSMSRGGSRRGGERNAEPAPDDSQAKAGDLSHFGKISKAAPMVMGPSSVFAGKKDPKRESITRTNSSSNMFSMLSQNPELVIEAKPSRAPSRRPSADLDKPEPQRKKLQLLPRTIPTPGEPSSSTSEEEPEAAPAGPMSEDDAKKKINEDVKEFFSVRNLDEADEYFTALTEEHRFRLVDKLVSSALESKEADARLVADFFSRSSSQRECSPDAFEAGFTPMVELLDDIAIDAPKAFEYMAIMLKGAGLDKDEERLKRMAEKMMDSDKLLQLVSS
ncbi:hypothetical protein EDC04DRAFT_2876735 [Pisolithus marmoratus]|nr:hypothetical protein EDC04DRAFT_2876735 [Pisolithus marmoratus]